MIYFYYGKVLDVKITSIKEVTSPKKKRIQIRGFKLKITK